LFDWDRFLFFLLPQESALHKLLPGSLPIREVIGMQAAYYKLQKQYPNYPAVDILEERFLQNTQEDDKEAAQAKKSFFLFVQK